VAGGGDSRTIVVVSGSAFTFQNREKNLNKNPRKDKEIKIFTIRK
jgi:hypothetical protein